MSKVYHKIRGLVKQSQLKQALEPQVNTFDTQLAITQILLRNGWESVGSGKIIKKVKAAFQQSPKIYSLVELPGNKLVVRDREGRVSAKVDLTKVLTRDQIMEAARTLNNGAAKVLAG